VKIVCNLADTIHTMMRNRESTHTIDTVTKTYTLMQDVHVDHLMRMQDLLPTNMMMMHDLLARPHDVDDKFGKLKFTIPKFMGDNDGMPMPTSHGSSRLTRSSECTITLKRRKSPWLPLSLKAMPIFGGSK
jgi:hypothetical protein